MHRIVRVSRGKKNFMPTHWVISAPRINDSLPGWSQLWWKFRWYLKFFNRRRVGAEYKVEEECNECQQKAAMMGKHFVKPIYIYIYIFVSDNKMVQWFNDSMNSHTYFLSHWYYMIHTYVHTCNPEHRWGIIILRICPVLFLISHKRYNFTCNFNYTGLGWREAGNPREKKKKNTLN